MRLRIFYNKFAFSWACSLIMFFSTTALADDFGYQNIPRYPQLVADGQSKGRQTNPWRLPERQESRPDYQQYYDYQAQQPQQYQNSQTDAQENRHDYQQYQGYQEQSQQQKGQFGKQYRDFGFVTPDILESLKQQQTQTQLMPENKQGRGYKPQRYGMGYYGYPSYGMGYSDPIYGSPAISPWGSNPGLLYRGNSFSLVPDAALGGLPPINIPPLGQPSDTEQPEYNVFDPFSLLPNAN